MSRAAVIDLIEASDLDLADRTDNQTVCSFVKMIPPVTPKPRTGKWIKELRGIMVTEYRCSECGRLVRDDTGYDVAKDYPFCHCGAKMEGGDEE